MNDSKSQKKQGFLYATLILGASTVIVKLLGALFRVPLTRLLYGSGMGYYSTAYDIFLPVYSLAMAGFPVAVARIVAEQVANGKFKDVKKTFKIVKTVFAITGTIGIIAMLIVAFVVTSAAENAGALPAALVIAPTIFFCCIMSAYRGYYEGLCNMFPTAVSSIIEAVCKLGLGYGFAWYIMNHMQGDELTVLSYAAAGAMVGITLGSVFGSLYLIILNKINHGGISNEQLLNSPEPEGSKAILKALIAISIPVAIGSLVNNVASLIDVTMVQRQLGNAVEKAPDIFYNAYGKYFTVSGFEASDIPNFLYGCYKGYAYSIYNLVPSITCVVGVSSIPILTTAWTLGNKEDIKTNIESMLRVIALLALPMGIGIMALAPQIISLLYPAVEAEIAVNLLRIMGIAACFAGMTTPLTNMLQAIGKPNVPVKNIAVGAVIKIVVNFIFVGIPEINIIGASIGTLACYAYIAVANIFCLVKYSNIKPNFVATILKPLTAALLCGASAYGVNLLLSSVITSEKITTVIAILVAVIVYVVAISILKCITADDVRTLPKGEKMVKIFTKLHIISSN